MMRYHYNHPRSTTFLLLVVLSSSYYFALGQEEPNADSDVTLTIYELLENNTKDFSDMLDIVNLYSDVKDLLSNSTGVLTLMAPVNQALEFNISKNALLYHMLPDKISLESLKGHHTWPTMLKLDSLGGQAQRIRIRSEGGEVKANGKRVVGPDAEATNGFLHGFNGTLRVPYLDLKSLYHSKPDLSAVGYVTLLLDQQKVNTSLQEPSTTLLAFGVKAFENFYKQDPVLYSYLIQSFREEVQEDLRSIVQCHILPNNLLYSDDIKEGSQLLRNALGEEVNITKVTDTSSNGTVKVEVSTGGTSAQLYNFDLLSTNGLAHVIDQVLLPESFKFTLRKALLGLSDDTFIHYLHMYNLTHILDGDQEYTVFAPSDDAWREAEKHDYTSRKDFSQILQYHIIDGAVSVLERNGTYTTINNKTIKVSSDGKKITIVGFNESTPAVVDLAYSTSCSNGHVYSIDRVLTITKENDEKMQKLIGWIIAGCMGAVMIAMATLLGLWIFIKRARPDSQGYQPISQ